MQNMKSQHSVPGVRTPLDSLLKLTYDENANKSNPEYAHSFNKKLAYLIIKVVVANSSLTINQVCGLLRKTLAVPEDLTRSVVQLLLAGSSTVAMLRSFPTTRGAIHLNVTGNSEELASMLLELEVEYPELTKYSAPLYRKGPVFKKGD